MKVDGVGTHIYIKGLLSPVCLKNLRNTKQLFVEFCFEIFSLNMIKCHIFSHAVPACENMWHFIKFRENIFHISLKRKNIL
jgi:hypothetical protein